MITPVSHLTAAGYRYIAKPLLFKTPPDIAHDRMIKSGRFWQRVAPVRAIMNGAWAYQNPRLEQQLLGLSWRNPLGLSAGLDKNFELVPLMKAIGFGFMEGGSITLEPSSGNPRPWFHRLPADRSLVVNAGLANHGSQAIITGLSTQHLPFDFPINISVAKTNSPDACTTDSAIQDYIGSLKLIKHAGVGQLITLNISCPNTYGGQPFTTPDLLEALLSATDEVNLKVPVSIKMPHHLEWPQFRDLAEVAANHRVAALTIANLAYRDQVSLTYPLPDHIKGKLGGRPTFEKSNVLIAHTRRHFEDRFVIIGVGGVFTAEDAYTKIKLGANLVEMITGLIFQGPQVVGHINRGLIELLDRDGLATIGEATGSGL